MKKYTLVLMLISCSSAKDMNLSGEYSRMFNFLELKEDSTFAYTRRGMTLEAQAFGDWKLITPKQIVLNSHIDIENLPLGVIEKKKNLPEKTIEILVDDEFDADLLHNINYEIIINRKDTIKQQNPIIYLPENSSLNTIKINAYYVYKNLPEIHTTRESVSTQEYKVKEKQSDYYLITFPFWARMFLYETIKNDTIEINGNKLNWKNKGKPKFKRVE